jgi:hypothetical protein
MRYVRRIDLNIDNCEFGLVKVNGVGISAVVEVLPPDTEHPYWVILSNPEAGIPLVTITNGDVEIIYSKKEN